MNGWPELFWTLTLGRDVLQALGRVRIGGTRPGRSCGRVATGQYLFDRHLPWASRDGLSDRADRLVILRKTDRYAAEQDDHQREAKPTCRRGNLAQAESSHAVAFLGWTFARFQRIVRAVRLAGHREAFGDENDSPVWFLEIPDHIGSDRLRHDRPQRCCCLGRQHLLDRVPALRARSPFDSALVSGRRDHRIDAARLQCPHPRPRVRWGFV